MTDPGHSTLPEAPAGASVRCLARHSRRLGIATLIFAAAVTAVGWLVTSFILQDLSQTHVASVIAQAKEEVEAVAQGSGDPDALGEGDRVSETSSENIDADALLAPVLPPPDSPASREAGPAIGVPSLGPGTASPERLTATIPANISRQGQEVRWLLQGELVGRVALQRIEVRYPGGRRIIDFTQRDWKDFDPRLLQEEGALTRVENVYRPSSRRVPIQWDTMLDGQPVTILADLDSDAIDAGTAELRRRVIPKVVAGGAIFVLLLVLAYAYVVRLIGEARSLDARASQQALLAQVGVLAAGLAHEIRNPLSAVRMNLQLLEEDLEESDAVAAPRVAAAGSRATASAIASDGSDHSALLRATQKEIGRLGTLVSDFLVYARPTAPRPAPVKVDTLARDTVELFRASAEGDGVSLEAELHAGDDPILVDEAMLKQALMNVVKNALEAVPKPGGHVVVATRREKGRLLLSVRDDGPGLPDDVEALFRIFHSTKKGGTGLGLAISRTLVERLGGTLTGKGSPSGGAEFTVSLPASAHVEGAA